MANLGTVSSEKAFGIRAEAEITVDPGTIPTGQSNFTLTLPPQFTANYPVAVVPLSQATVDGATVQMAANTTISVVSTSVSGSTLTVNLENSGSGADPGSVRFLLVQFCGEGA